MALMIYCSSYEHERCKASLEPKAIITAPIHWGPNPHVMNEKVNVSATNDNEFPVKTVIGIRNNCLLLSKIKRNVFCAREKNENFSSKGFTGESVINQLSENATTIKPLNQYILWSRQDLYIFSNKLTWRYPWPYKVYYHLFRHHYMNFQCQLDKRHILLMPHPFLWCLRWSHLNPMSENHAR